MPGTLRSSRSIWLLLNVTHVCILVSILLAQRIARNIWDRGLLYSCDLRPELVDFPVALGYRYRVGGTFTLYN